MNRIAVAELTSEAFAPFGEVGAPLAGAHRTGDVALELSRFYIMRLDQRGLAPLVFAT
ncbi:MAG TPA: hypothetical protein VF924_02320 [Stellaceae bacterium]|jgi:hypothetical protein